MDYRAVDHAPRRPAIFFDRDGVINVDRGYVHLAEELEFVSGAAAALRLVRDAGYLTFIVTNQSGVARGFFSEATVRAFHQHMLGRLDAQGAAIDDLRFCPHHVDGTVPSLSFVCDCRKPRPGMILDLAGAWNVDLARSFLIGDQETDMLAARAAGVPGRLFPGGDLAQFVAQVIRSAAPTSGEDSS